MKSSFYHKKNIYNIFLWWESGTIVYELVINKVWGMALDKTNNMATSKISKKENDVKRTFLFSNFWFFV